LLGALQSLFPANSERRLAELLKKQGDSGLSDAERIELQGLLTVDRSGSDGTRPRT